MGNLCSKSLNHEGGHVILSSETSGGNAARSQGASAPPNPRAAAAEAAERRIKAAQTRGIHGSNPNRGKLSDQLAKQNSSKVSPEEQIPERLVYD
ncbi:hypothetical protein CPB83DRAFT_857824 [Crepidotus variabilis]|uniref:Uncharacterized protein n=1 Tax=Crepidotus variabilis TaxID=179855 RepID=A0A9P6JN94_9AGAR|nr:hypothetical protein CPB83DRAFT_857824 [Crepidotus variabilis]